MLIYTIVVFLKKKSVKFTELQRGNHKKLIYNLLVEVVQSYNFILI